MHFNKNIAMMYDIYPCDLTWDGSCPKAVQDCRACRGWTNAQADAQIAREESREREFLLSKEELSK